MAKRKATATARRPAPKAQPADAAPVAVEVTPADSVVEPIGDTHSDAPAVTGAPPVHPEPSHEHVQAAHSSKKPHRALDVFLIDSGWNNPICSAVRENLPAVAGYLKGHRFFVMSKEKSLDFIQRHPVFIGADPLLLVLDPLAAAKKDSVGCGFRLSLGHVRHPEVAISMLKWAMQLTMTASMAEMATLVRKSGHRETFQGVVELVGESANLLEFAPI
eukprot:TRINITY_DN34921_c0_g1_i1.p1 TRINITY_DN34921_c0_g1~~TRINITY_DN34921_c0_g1_i1.p1  ORF type:complete len:218 (+),score=5.66 TRINITY_DN34921_c0_g1_i1:87-740(+)